MKELESLLLLMPSLSVSSGARVFTAEADLCGVLHVCSQSFAN